MNYKDLSKKETKIVQEIDRIRNIIYSYNENDAEWVKKVRPYKFAIERDELIRNFIISHHLLTEEFLNVELLKYFIKFKRQSKRYCFFENFILQKLSYKEKLDLSYQAKLISKGTYEFLEQVNSLRNKCAHRWFLKDKKIKLLYNRKDLLNIDNFEQFAEDIFTFYYNVLWNT